METALMIALGCIATPTLLGFHYIDYKVLHFRNYITNIDILISTNLSLTASYNGKASVSMRGPQNSMETTILIVVG